MKTKKKPFDKYRYYLDSVQNPKEDVRFITKTFLDLKKKTPVSFREDFCFTFALCVEWVKHDLKNKAYGVDIDPTCLAYGKTHYLSPLPPSSKKRVQVCLQNVLKKAPFPRVDILVALNFSYFVFKTRDLLKKYFKKCYSNLKNNGVLVLDCFGGSECQEANTEKRGFDSFMYYWEQKEFDPVSNCCQFSIHYRPKGKAILKNVFSYDWRLWSIPEITDLLKEVGFKKSHIYWEGTRRDGSGNGIFKPVEKGEECEAWVAYIFAEK